MALLLNKKDKEWLINNYPNYFIEELCEMYHCGEVTIYETLRKYGVNAYRLKRRYGWTLEEIRILRENMNKPMRELCALLDRTPKAIEYKKKEIRIENQQLT